MEPESRFQFSLRGLLVFTTACAAFWASLEIIDSPARSVSICLSLPGLLALAFCLASVNSQRKGLDSKISIAIASTFLSLALVLSLFRCIATISFPG
jgi:hypothetical protein